MPIGTKGFQKGNKLGVLRKGKKFIHSGSFKKGHKDLVPPESRKKQSERMKGNKYGWRGDKVGYDGIHDWIRKYGNTIQRCEICKTEEKRRYEWANISHEYKRDFSDWIRLCVPCHSAYDRGKIKLPKRNLHP